MIAIKCSTILTKDNYKILENNIYSQFYDVVLYINNYSDLIEGEKSNFVNLLNNKSILL